MTKLKPEAIAAVAGLVTILAGGGSWLLTLENRITNKADKTTLTREIKDLNDKTNTKLKDMKDELNTDIRIMRERLNQIP